MKYWFLLALTASASAWAADDCAKYVPVQTGDVIPFNGKSYRLAREVARYENSQWFALVGVPGLLVRIASPQFQKQYVQDEPTHFANRAEIIDFNSHYVFVREIPAALPFWRVMDVMRATHNVVFVEEKRRKTPFVDQLTGAIVRKIRRSPADVPRGAHFTIDEQIALISLAKFFIEAERHSFALHSEWLKGVVWSQELQDWYLATWE